MKLELGRRNQDRLALGFGYVALAAFLVWTLLPFYWMVSTSLKPDSEMYAVKISLWPKQFTLSHYSKVVFKSSYTTQFRNSMFISVSTTVLSMAIGSLAAYAITRLHFKGREIFARVMVFGYLIPNTVLFIPLFTIMQRLGLINTIWALILAYLTFAVPFCTWLLISYFRTIPIELEEAALVDGATRLQTLFRIVLPVSTPALVVVALFSFTLSWNEFLYALVLTTNQYSRTATVGINTMVAEDVFYWGMMMAASVIAAAPPVLMYLFSQKWVVGGLTLGAVKQ